MSLRIENDSTTDSNQSNKAILSGGLNANITSTNIETTNLVASDITAGLVTATISSPSVTATAANVSGLLTASTINSANINNTNLCETKELQVGSGSSLIHKIKFGRNGFALAFTPDQWQQGNVILFGTTFSSIPRVVCSIENGGGHPTEYVTFQIQNISTTGFTVGLANPTSNFISSVTYYVNWIAIE